MQTNPGCESCDYFNSCGKTIIFNSKSDSPVKVRAKEQEKIRMRCVNKVQDICKDCAHFHNKKCASWKILNNKTLSKGTLTNCPSKVIIGG